jgi:hypothetical protein
MSVIDTSLEVVGNIKVNYPLTRQFIDDLLVTAFEGGINYWCSKVYPVDNIFPEGAVYTSDCLSRGRHIVIVEESDEDGNQGKNHILTLDNLLFGIKCFMNMPNANNIFDDYDAWDADTIVQFAIFGDIIYG